MTVRINKPALNLREELTKAQSVVPYVQQQFWMDGLVENGTFDTNTTGWAAENVAVSVVSNRLRITSTGAASARVSQTVSGLVAGKTYMLTGEAERISGSSSVSLSLYDTPVTSGFMGNALGNVTNLESGQYVFTATDDSVSVVAQIINAAGAGEIADFDNIQVFELDENDEVIHSLPLGWKPLHVYEDGLIQREGDVHDYTVVKTGGAYAIKPAVQPTGATETCVIAEREL